MKNKQKEKWGIINIIQDLSNETEINPSWSESHDPDPDHGTWWPHLMKSCHTPEQNLGLRNLFIYI